MLHSTAEIEGKKLLLDALFADALASGKPYTREQLERRMGFVAEAGITDAEEFKRHVLSDDGA
jgi:hypothetical protein